MPRWRVRTQRSRPVMHSFDLGKTFRKMLQRFARVSIGWRVERGQRQQRQPQSWLAVYKLPSSSKLEIVPRIDLHKAHSVPHSTCSDTHQSRKRTTGPVLSRSASPAPTQTIGVSTPRLTKFPSQHPLKRPNQSSIPIPDNDLGSIHLVSRL